MLASDLKGFNSEANVIIDGKPVVAIQNLDNGDIYLSSTKKIGECKECGHATYALSKYHGGEYVAYCPQCDNNKTEFGFIKK